MNTLKPILITLLSLSLFLALPGCSKSPAPPTLSLSEADQKFTDILQNEFHYKPIVRPLGKTLWVYMPGEREIFKYKATESTEQSPQKKFAIEYLDGKFEDNRFVIDYDIIPAIKASNNNGLSSSFTDEFNKEYQNSLGAIKNSYLDIKIAPDFIGIIFADVKNGLAMTNIFSLDDFKQNQASALSNEEYLLRTITETKGNKTIIDDWEGKKFDFKEITWPDFLTKQIINRINFKYQRSDFPPQEDATKEIAKLISITTKYYHFTDFISAKINNLRDNKEQSFSQWDIRNLSDH